MPQDIQQKVTFDATPAVIYAALMNSKNHAAFTGAPAKIEPVVGGKVSAHGGFISAINIELVKGTRIVQAWRGNDWAKGAWSIARFELAPAGTGQTRLTLTQSGVPDEHAKGISLGWKQFYWDPISKWLAGSRSKPAKAKPRPSKRTKKR